MTFVGPSRSAKCKRETVTPIGCICDVAQDVNVFVARNTEWIESLDVLGEAVNDVLIFTRECAKDAIPDDEHSTVVAVNVLRVDAVMNAVM